MAIYFQLTRIGSREPSTFQTIDCAICQSLGLPWDNIRYVEGWYDVIGFMLASGKTFAQITDYLNERVTNGPVDWSDGYRNLLRINHYLLENYSTEAWGGR